MNNLKITSYSLSHVLLFGKYFTVDVSGTSGMITFRAESPFGDDSMESVSNILSTLLDAQKQPQLSPEEMKSSEAAIQAILKAASNPGVSLEPGEPMHIPMEQLPIDSMEQKVEKAKKRAKKPASPEIPPAPQPVLTPGAGGDGFHVANLTSGAGGEGAGVIPKIVTPAPVEVPVVEPPLADFVQAESLPYLSEKVILPAPETPAPATPEPVAGYQSQGETVLVEPPLPPMEHSGLPVGDVAPKAAPPSNLEEVQIGSHLLPKDISNPKNTVRDIVCILYQYGYNTAEDVIGVIGDIKPYVPILKYATNPEARVAKILERYIQQQGEEA